LTKEFKHIFFDLDRTLWDFEANSQDEILFMYTEFRLVNLGISLPLEFVKVYKQFNELCWDKYLKGNLSQAELRYKRFFDTLNYFGIKDLKMAKKMGQLYVERSPFRTKLIEHSIDVLIYLKSKNYQLHIITNGFEEVQHIKLRESKLEDFFTTITTSEMANAKKPDPRIFDFAITLANATKEESLYVGDDLLVDIEGAINAGIEAIYFNPNKKTHNMCTFLDISSLIEIKSHF
jgi:putative hydrolase of the HAD superfamily